MRELLPEPEMEKTVFEQLKEIMLGAVGYSHKHEWIKHGTCYGTNANQYFLDSITLVLEINNSEVSDFLKNHIGQTIQSSELKTLIDREFGQGAAQKVEIRCDDQDHFNGINIKLKRGECDDLTLSTLMRSDDNSRSNCAEFTIQEF